MTNAWFKRNTLWTIVILSFAIRHSAHCHPADQSEMRVRPAPHQLEVRLTFNVMTLTKFVRMDADGDGKLAFEELKAAESQLVLYLNEHVKLEINQQKAVLGSRAQFDYLWPNEDTTPPMALEEYAARNVDVTFTKTLGALLEDFWIGFEIFEQTGPMQTIRGVFEQDGQIEEVPFNFQEPEYTYDTGFKEDPFVQAAEKKPTEEPTEKRWWMLRLGVLIVLIVFGRVSVLNSRLRKSATRRR